MPNDISHLGQMSRERSLRTADWVAEFLSVTKEWVAEATRSGTLPCIRVGAEVRFDPGVIKTWGRAAGPATGLNTTPPTSGSIPLKEIRSDLRRLKSATIQPGAVAITVEQAAARLGCAKTRIFDLLKSGELKRGKRIGKRTMVLVSSIDSLTDTSAGAKRPAPKPKGGQPQTRAEILKALKKRP